MPIKEKQFRNKAVIILHLCGFSLREIAEVVGGDRRNIQLFVKKYKPRYLEDILIKVAKSISDKMLEIKPQKNGGQNSTKDS